MSESEEHVIELMEALEGAVKRAKAARDERDPLAAEAGPNASSPQEPT